MVISRRGLGWVSAGAVFMATLGRTSKSAAQSSEEAALGQAVEGFRKAMLAADRAQFEALCAEELSYGHSAGRLETKAQFITASTSGRSVWKFITLSDPTVRVVGHNGIVRHVLTGETESEGKTNAIKIGILMVWLKQDTSWKLLARQAYRI